MVSLRVPSDWQSTVDLAILLIRAKPSSDAEAMQPICNLCGMQTPLFNTKGDCCINCLEPHIRYMQPFEPLPLVRFTPPDRITPKYVLDVVGRNQRDDASAGLLRQQLDLSRRTDKGYAPVHMILCHLEQLERGKVFVRDLGYAQEYFLHSLDDRWCNAPSAPPSFGRKSGRTRCCWRENALTAGVRLVNKTSWKPSKPRTF